jgi:hypothetical protein
MENTILTCSDIIKQFNLNVDCCLSCHYEFDEGYTNEMCVIHLDSGEEVNVCCNVSHAYQLIIPH